MQQAAAESSVSPSSFASFLDSLAAPPQSAGPEWNDDLLSDDVATLSHEQPLRTHGQDRPLASDREPDPGSESGQSRPDRSVSAFPDRNVKRASITIRLTEPEAAQLRHRAAEAGLTVSAYLRSCVLEVESLRTPGQSETLAQLRESLPSRSADANALRRSRGPGFHFWSLGARIGIGGRAARKTLTPPTPPGLLYSTLEHQALQVFGLGGRIQHHRMIGRCPAPFHEAYLPMRIGSG